MHNPKTFWNDYQAATQETAIYPGQGSLAGLVYVALGLAGEAGETCENVKKLIRDDGNALTPERAEKLRKELGDVLWYLARSAHEMTLVLGDVVTEPPSDSMYRPVPGLGTSTGLAFIALTLFRSAALFGDEVSDAMMGDGVSELSDISPMLTDVFYAANLFARALDTNLQAVAEENLAKLRDRKDRGVLHGSGDKR